MSEMLSERRATVLPFIVRKSNRAAVLDLSPQPLLAGQLFHRAIW